MDASKAIRWSTIAAVTLLAAVAGWISYTHALDVVRVYHVPSPEQYAYPATVDGLIYSASMVVLHAARQGLGRWHYMKVYGWGVLGLGVGVTGAVNAWAGLPYGVGGAVTYAWPAVALVLSYEGLMLLIRNSQQRPETQETQRPQMLSAEERRQLAAAGMALPGGEYRFGGVPSIRSIMREEGVGFPKAKERQAALANGQSHQ